jgi:hypothetical protein
MFLFLWQGDIHYLKMICNHGQFEPLFFPPWKHQFPGESEGARQLGLMNQKHGLEMVEI